MSRRYVVIAALLAAIALPLSIAVATAPPTPATAPRSEALLRVVGQRAITLPSGQRLLAFSPDGQRLAVLQGRKLCVAPIAEPTQATCANLDADGVSSVDQQMPAWSPDGTRLAFTENSVQYLYDSDIWLMDVRTGALRDLTDDHFTGPLPLFGHATPAGGGAVPVDVAPAWSPDGRTLYFVRSMASGAGLQGTFIERVPAEGGSPTLVTIVTFREPLIVYVGGLHVAKDGQTIYFTISHTASANPDNGVWSVRATGGVLHRVARTTNQQLGYPILLDVAATGRWGLVAFYNAPQQTQAGARLGLLNLQTGRSETLATAATGGKPGADALVAAFSPDGSLFVAGWATAGNGTDQWLTIRNLASGTSREILAGGFAGVPLTVWQSGLTWATNGTLLASTSPSAAVVVRLGPI